MPTEHPDPEIQLLDRLIARAEAAEADLRTERQGLQLARARRLQELAAEAKPVANQLSDTATAPVGVVSAEDAEWRALSRTDAVLRALDESDTKSLHRKILTDQLIAHGRADETVEAVSAALAYLARNHRVTSMTQGWWRLGPPHESSFAEKSTGTLDLGVTRPELAASEGRSRENRPNE